MALSLMLWPLVGMAEEQLAIITPGPAPAVPQAELDELSRHSWTALPSSSLVAVTSVGDPVLRADLWKSSRVEPLDAWRLAPEDPAIAADLGPRAATFRSAVRKPQRGVHRRLLPGGLDLDIKGDYGRTPRPMRAAVRIIDDSKLLRWGAELRKGGLRLGGEFGNKAHPVQPGETLSWSALARYDRGAVSLGLVYSYTLDTQSNDGSREDAFGSVQGGFSYAVTDRITASMNAAYWDTMTAEGRTESNLGGLVGISWRF